MCTQNCASLLSLPPRGAWIEIPFTTAPSGMCRRSLPPRGAWIEIVEPKTLNQITTGRSPHGERGLKSIFYFSNGTGVSSLPPRGAWIEIAP